MRGKRKLRERLMAFVTAFAMIAGMVMEPVNVSALPEELVGAQSVAQTAADESQQIPAETEKPPADSGDGNEVNPPAPSVTKIVVSGQVLCGETAVDGAKISIGESVVYTTADGTFSCEVGADQSYAVKIEKEGFMTKEFSVNAEEGNINLDSSQLELLDIVLDKESVSAAVDSSDNITIVNRVSYASYSWTILDESVATVTEGMVTGVRSGSTTGTVTMNTPYGVMHKNFAVGINMAVPNMTFSIDPVGGVDIQNINLTAQITLGTGTVKFYCDNNLIGEVSVENNIAQMSYTLPGNGKHTFKAEYSGVEGKYTAVSKEIGDAVYKGSQEIAFSAHAPQNIVYGDEFSISVDTDAFEGREENPVYTIAVEGQCLKINENNGSSAKIEAIKTGEEKIIVTRQETESWTESTKMISVNIGKKQIYVDQDNSKLEIEKTYDMEDTFHLALNGSTKQLLFKDEKGSSVDADVKSVQVKIQQKDAGEYKAEDNVTVTVENITLQDTVTDNYKIMWPDETRDLKADITIKPRGIDLEVIPKDLSNTNGFVTRQYGRSGAPFMNGNEEAKFTVQVRENPQMPVLEKDKETIKKWTEGLNVKDITKDDTLVSDIPYDAIAPDLETDKGLVDKDNVIQDCKNYKVNEKTYNYPLKIIPMDIEGFDDFSKYIQFDHAYVDADNNIWIRGGLKGEEYKSFGASVSLVPDTHLYTGIILEAGENTRIADDNIIIPEPEDAAAASVLVTLCSSAEDGQSIKCSVPFKVDLKVDAEAPVVKFGDIEEKSTSLGTAVKDILFGLFGKTKGEESTTFSQSFSIKDDGVGMEKDGRWEYTKFYLDGISASEEELQSYIDEDKVKWDKMGENDINTQGCISFQGDKEGHCILAVKAYDQLGNNRIYCSNGMVLEDNKPVVYIKDSIPDFYNIKDKGTDITYNVVIADVVKGETPETISSGIKCLKYRVYKKDNGKEVILQEQKITNLSKKEYSWDDLNIENDVNYVKMETECHFHVTDEYDSNFVYFEAIAVDNAGNERPFEQQLKFDFTLPDIDVEFAQGEGTEVYKYPDGPEYYDGECIAEVTFSDLNLLKENKKDRLKIYVQTGDEEGPGEFDLLNQDDINKLKESGIRAEEVVSEMDKDNMAAETQITERKFRFVFEGDGHFKNIKFEAADEAGNINDKNLERDFVIDKTDPDMDIYYNVNGEKVQGPISDRYYTNAQAVTLNIDITEENFSSGDDVKIELKSFDGDNSEITDLPEKNGIENIENWTKITQDDKVYWHYEFVYTEEAKYTHSIKYTDLAGHKAELKKSLITIDRMSPKGTITVRDEPLWADLLDSITFGGFTRFFNCPVKVGFTGEDSLSPIEKFQYVKLADPYEGDIESYSKWKDIPTGEEGLSELMKLSGELSLEPNQQFVIYARIIDRAGNARYLKTTHGVVLDKEDPKVSIKIMNEKPAKNGIYAEDLKLQFEAEDPKVGDTYSGLKRVWYTINGSEERTLIDNSQNPEQGHQTFSGTDIISAEKYNSNNVQIQMFAQDFSDNEGKSDIFPIKIDVTKPVVDIKYSSDVEPKYKFYYKQPRTAEITIKERNLDVEDADSVFFTLKRKGEKEESVYSLSKLVKLPGIKLLGIIDSEKDVSEALRTDERTTTITIEFNGDNDYTFDAHCRDLGGLLDENGDSKQERFIVDKTEPNIEVEFSNGSETKEYRYDTEKSVYYDGKRTVKVTYSDWNLLMGDAADALNFHMRTEDTGIDQTYNLLNEKDVETLRNMTSSLGKKDKIFDSVTIGKTKIDENEIMFKTITLVFNGDEHYSNISFDCTDIPGNPAVKTSAEDFIIDKTAPVMKVTYNIDGQKMNGPITERTYTNAGQISMKVEIAERNFKKSDDSVDAVNNSNPQYNDAITNLPENKGIERGEKWKGSGNSSKLQWTYDFSYTEEAKYTQSLTYTDLAGHVVKMEGSQFTIDRTDPEGTISVRDEPLWEKILNSITFNGFRRFYNKPINVDFSGNDSISPIEPIQYATFTDVYEDIRSYDAWSEIAPAVNERTVTAGRLSMGPDQQFIVYAKITDKAGNVTYLNTVEGTVLDDRSPEPKITITNLSQAQNGIFSGDVQLQIDVEDPTSGDTYSGLEKVWYTINTTGNVSVDTKQVILDNSDNKVQSHKTFSYILPIEAEIYNSNDVQVRVFASDFAGNEAVSEVTQLKIDKTNPVISVSWDLNDPLNGRYYKDTRTATVTVRERNFDPNNVRFTITNTDGSPASIGEWSVDSAGVSDDAVNTCQVSFPSDGDYTFTFGCTDLAGNSAEYGQTDEFTIDKTVPVITVSYDNNNAKNGNYYKEARTATVSVKEHNFNASEVKTAITASLLGQGITAPSVGGFSNNGDVHEATIKYEADGDYTFDVDYTDMAGNAAADYTPERFTVDRTAPEVEIFDVKDKSANNDVVAPGVKYSDNNYDKKNVSIKIEGANNGSVDIGKVVSAINNGESIKLNDFPREEKMDDLYKLTAKVTDKAGNATEKSILFSVNRYGSVYVLDNDTKDWLRTDGEEYTYINQERELGIMEYNVDEVDVSKITSNRDGELTNLKENTDYTVKKSGSEVQWKEYYYKLAADNFSEEGNYTVTLYSEDKAKNSMNNESVKKTGKKLPLEFTVDKTAPTVVVSGVEDGGQYRASNRSMTVDAKDNIALKEVSIAIDGEKKTYRDEELRDLNGVIKTQINSANKWQSLEITAQDAAGNILGQKKAGEKVQPLVMAVLVTPNIVVQYYMNKPVFFGSLGFLVALAAVIIVIVMRRKQQNR